MTGAGRREEEEGGGGGGGGGGGRGRGRGRRGMGKKRNGEVWFKSVKKIHTSNRLGWGHKVIPPSKGHKVAPNKAIPPSKGHKHTL